jgi:predicted RNase H-like nuclease
MQQTDLVCGVDGCPAGWIAVLWRGPGSDPTSVLCADFSAVLALPVNVIAIDMPIGIPDLYGREADRHVRQLIGARRSSVFPVPARPTLDAASYQEACAINRRHSDPSRAVSRECFGLIPKIREIDSAMDPTLQDRIFESHPELAFRTMSGVPLAESKRSRAGAELRKSLLRKHGLKPEALLACRHPRWDCKEDDLIDAAALAWVARRIRDGENQRFPSDPPRDARGLRMEINT